MPTINSTINTMWITDSTPDDLLSSEQQRNRRPRGDATYMGPVGPKQV